MNVPTITMDPDQAKAKLKAYRRELHHGADETYQAAADGYKALAQGLPLIDINQAIEAGGFFPEGYPRLAIARADRKVVRCEMERNGFLFVCATSNERKENLRVRVSMDPPSFRAISWRYTRIPMIPADVRGKLRAGRRSLRWANYHILWEVERWYERNPIEPPIDPFLLKHCGGSLYAVLAEWDLTELERSVMRGLVGG